MNTELRRKIERVIWEHAIREAAHVLDSKYASLRVGGTTPHSGPARLVWDRLYDCTPPLSELMGARDNE